MLFPRNFSRKLTSGVKKYAMQKPYIKVIRISFILPTKLSADAKNTSTLSRNFERSIQAARTIKLYIAILVYFLSGLNLRKLITSRKYFQFDCTIMYSLLLYEENPLIVLKS